MATFDHIGGQEPSTVSFKLATVTQTRNSSKMHQEILSIGDPDVTNAIAAVLAAVPASTAWGVVTREAGGFLSSLGGIVTVALPAALVSSGVLAGNSSALSVRNVWSSTNADQPVSAAQSGNWTVSLTLGALQSSAAAAVGSSALLTRIVGAKGDNLVTVYQSSAAEFQATVTPAAGSTWTVRALNSSAADLQATVTPLAGSTWNVRALNSSAADFLATVTPVVGSTWNVRALNSSAADLQMTATPLAGSTWNVRPIQSSAADLQVTATIGTNLQSTGAPSSNSSGLIVRQVIDNLLVTASSNFFTSSLVAIGSTAAGQRCKVYGYSITTTNQTPTKLAFYGGSSMKWPVVLAALSSAVSGANLVVAPPAYLFACAQGSSMTFRIGTSGVGWKVAVAYFMGP